MPDVAQLELERLERVWAERGVEINAYISTDSWGRRDLHLSRIIVARPLRGQGIGTRAMNELVALADRHELLMTLSPAVDFGGSSVERLKKFYRRFGFVSNKGRHKDFTLNDSMYRRHAVISPGLEGRKTPWSPRFKDLTPQELALIPIWPEFVDAYLEAALWASSVGDNESHLDDQGYAIHDFTQKAINEAVEQSNAFILANMRDLTVGGQGRLSRQQHGHDFWLSRNGHGAGFLDRGYGDAGKRLQKAAKTYGELSAYVGDDGKIYFR